MKPLHVVFSESKGIINKNLYGHFAEHIGGVYYDGLWVGQDSDVENVRGFRKRLVDSFKRLNPPILRWPGGCFAETYDWRDGIGPAAERPSRVNWWYSDDRRIESNRVGTHEFMDFCRMVGAEPYFAANMTSVTPLHIRNWMEYCNFPEGLTTLSSERAANGAGEPFGVRYWGIGNENWGGGGQMTPEQCAREYIRYTTVCNSLDKGNMKFILCGANGDDLEWTSRLMREWADRKWREAPTYGMSVHYYCGAAGDPVAFSDEEWYRLLHRANRVGKILDDHRAAMAPYDPKGEIGIVLDEWGCWHPAGSGPSGGANLFEQQSTLRDAAVAALTLNALNERCDSVAMANVAQLCNNLHTLFFASGDRFCETPTYHVYDLFKRHMGARQLRIVHDCGAFEMEGFAPMGRVSSSASVGEDGSALITLANLSVNEDAEFEVRGVDGSLSGELELSILQGASPRDHNDFDHPSRVFPTHAKRPFRDGDSIRLPAASVAAARFIREPR